MHSFVRFMFRLRYWHLLQFSTRILGGTLSRETALGTRPDSARNICCKAPRAYVTEIAVLIGLLFCAEIYCHSQSVSDNPSSETHTRKRIPPKDDIDAIGTRNIGKRGIGEWYSLEQEAKMGRQYAKDIDDSTKLLDDPLVNEYVNRVAQNIVRNSDAKVAFTVKIIDSDDVNAFALPGGFMYVNTGLILATQDEAELAGVMAHEIAHVAAHHATRQMTRQKMFDFASLPLIFVGGGVGMVLQTAVDAAKPLGLTRFSRGFEAEADYLGAQYLYKAGYDPTALISFFERINTMQRRKPGAVAKAFSTHPETRDRIKKLQREFSQLFPKRDFYEVSTSDFDEVVHHLSSLQQSTRAPAQPSRPTLKRHLLGQSSGSISESDVIVPMQ